MLARAERSPQQKVESFRRIRHSFTPKHSNEPDSREVGTVVNVYSQSIAAPGLKGSKP